LHGGAAITLAFYCSNDAAIGPPGFAACYFVDFRRTYPE